MKVWAHWPEKPQPKPNTPFVKTSQLSLPHLWGDQLLLRTRPHPTPTWQSLQNSCMSVALLLSAGLWLVVFISPSEEAGRLVSSIQSWWRGSGYLPWPLEEVMDSSAMASPLEMFSHCAPCPLLSLQQPPGCCYASFKAHVSPLILSTPLRVS